MCCYPALSHCQEWDPLNSLQQWGKVVFKGLCRFSIQKYWEPKFDGVQNISAIQILPDRHRHPGLERWQTWSPGSSPVQDLKITKNFPNKYFTGRPPSPLLHRTTVTQKFHFFWTRAIFSLRNGPNLGAWRVSDRKPLILKNTMLDFKIQCFLCKIEINEIYMYIFVTIFNLREGVGPSAEYMPISQPNPRDLDWNLF